MTGYLIMSSCVWRMSINICTRGVAGGHVHKQHTLCMANTLYRQDTYLVNLLFTHRSDIRKPPLFNRIHPEIQHLGLKTRTGSIRVVSELRK